MKFECYTGLGEGNAFLVYILPVTGRTRYAVISTDGVCRTRGIAMHIHAARGEARKGRRKLVHTCLVRKFLRDKRQKTSLEELTA